MRDLILITLSTLALAAQVGPYPPGQYPRGRYPQSGPKVPGTTRESKSKTEQQAAAQPRTFSGVIRGLSEKSLDLDTTDTRILTIQISDKTVKPAGLKVGDGVDVEATQDKDGLFQAVSIQSNPKVAQTIGPRDALEMPAPSAQQPQPPEDAGPPSTILVPDGPRYDEGDSGPPKLKRGIPAPKPGPKFPEPVARSGTSASTSDSADASVPAVQSNQRQEFLARARAVAAGYLERLPNFVCQEVVTRYVSETRVTNWSAVDVVAAELVYEKGRESYGNVTINGKPSKKPPEESGSWSTGEFGSILASLFSLGTSATFRYVQEARMNRLPALVYDFQVARPHSTWRIQIPGQYILPAYKGTVWLDKEGAHALRIEMQARQIPEEFPRAVVETSVDYEYISLGTPEKFLLPVRAETLSCARGSNSCDRNVIEFRNYHKFTGESTIKFSPQ